MRNFRAGLIGVAIGDALGVPVEFRSRKDLDLAPVDSMIGFGTHYQPPGTWSDDSSLSFCLADSLVNGYDLKDIAEKFIEWKTSGLWTATGVVFDIGITTRKSINELRDLLSADMTDELISLKTKGDEWDNGNGSLMRVFPLLLEFVATPGQDRFDKVWDVSALTHKHIRSAVSCYIYLSYLELLCQGTAKEVAYAQLRSNIDQFFKASQISTAETMHFDRLISNDIRDLTRTQIGSGGYVIDTLESSFWAFLTSSDFNEAVLKAVNLGHDTDTTGAVTGGLAGFYYGMDSIPHPWIDQLARSNDILNLGEELTNRYGFGTH